MQPKKFCLKNDNWLLQYTKWSSILVTLAACYNDINLAELNKKDRAHV